LFYTEIAKKSVTNSLQNRSVRKAFHFTNVTDSFQIRLTFATAEYASWVCTVCTVFKYISLQKRYPKLLIKFGTDFEVGQKQETVPFRFTLGTNNLETIPK
jgi:hypothetical protein